MRYVVLILLLAACSPTATPLEPSPSPLVGQLSTATVDLCGTSGDQPVPTEFDLRLQAAFAGRFHGLVSAETRRVACAADSALVLYSLIDVSALDPVTLGIYDTQLVELLQELRPWPTDQLDTVVVVFRANAALCRWDFAAKQCQTAASADLSQLLPASLLAQATPPALAPSPTPHP